MKIHVSPLFQKSLNLIAVNFSDTKVTGSLCDSEICEFWPKIKGADFIYARLYKGCGYPTVDISDLYLCNFSFFRIIVLISCSHK